MNMIRIHGGSLVLGSGIRKADILIQNGCIAGMVESDMGIEHSQVIDASGLVVLSGVIDGHTHFFHQDPDAGIFDEAAVEGFEKGGAGAAAGGITCTVEMPQAIPPTKDGDSFQRKRVLSEKETIVDFALWGGVVPNQPQKDILDQIQAGAVGFKAFLCSDDPDFLALDDATLKSTLELLKDSGRMLALHCENDALNRAGRERMQKQGRTDPAAYAESRPVINEEEAVNRVIFFAEKTGGWAHIAHMSSPDGAELVKRAKQRGIRITAETCPQYLALDIRDLLRLGPYGKCAPPLRTAEQVDRMWDYLADGTIDCITSDHCSWSKASKDPGFASIWEAPNGLPGVQTLLPAIITEGRRKGFTWERISQWCSEVPARLWHLEHVKGSISVGRHADLVLIDPERVWELRAEEILHTEQWSPFVGKQFKGRIVRTLVRGETVYQDGLPEKIAVRPGFGRFIKG